MLVVKLIEIGEKLMKLLSECDIRIDDFKYLDLYSDYQEMKKLGYKMTYIVTILSEKYHIGIASVYRVLNRFGKTIKT